MQQNAKFEHLHLHLCDLGLWLIVAYNQLLDDQLCIRLAVLCRLWTCAGFSANQGRSRMDSDCKTQACNRQTIHLGEASIFCWFRCQAFQNQHEPLIIHYSTLTTITTIPEISCFRIHFYLIFLPTYSTTNRLPPTRLPNSKVGQEVEAFWTQDHWWSASTACALRRLSRVVVFLQQHLADEQHRRTERTKWFQK